MIDIEAGRTLPADNAEADVCVTRAACPNWPMVTGLSSGRSGDSGAWAVDAGLRSSSSGFGLAGGFNRQRPRRGTAAGDPA